MRPTMPVQRRFQSLALATLAIGLATIGLAGMQTTPAAQGDPLIAGFKSTYAASVSDAVELVTGKNGTMRYDMKLMTGTNLVGRAVTSLARRAPRTEMRAEILAETRWNRAGGRSGSC